MVIRTSRALTVLCSGFIVTAALSFALLGARAPNAIAGGAAPCYGTGTFPAFLGTPPWGFRTGPTPAPLAGSGSFARAYGSINLNTGTISGHICQVDLKKGVREQIIISPISPILFHTHHAMMWGYPGNEVRTHIVVRTSTDPTCTVGTRGTMTMYASYNNVRSDSIHFTFSKGCASHDHMYHGSQVNAQVPPE
jgi:hypothetical protein